MSERSSSLRHRKKLENRPDNSAIKQQRLPAAQPVITTSAVRITSLVLVITCSLLGAFIIIESKSIQNYSIDYTNCKAITFFNAVEEKEHDNPNSFKNSILTNKKWLDDQPLINTCKDIYDDWFKEAQHNKTENWIDLVHPPTCVCVEDLKTEQITKTSYVYYKLDNFYQNHRRMLRSRDNNQLLAMTTEAVINPPDSCYVIKGIDRPKHDFPCGSLANSFFNDSIFIYDTLPSDDSELMDKIVHPNVEAWSLKGDGIAWKTDIVQKFDSDNKIKDLIGATDDSYNTIIGNEVKNPPNWQKGIGELGTENDLYYRRLSDTSGKGLKNEDFIVWMRTPAYVNFKKLYRTREDHVSEGIKKMLIFYNFNVHMFDGSKSIILGTTSWAGGDNTVLGTIYCVTGALSFLLFVITFFVGKE